MEIYFRISQNFKINFFRGCIKEYRQYINTVINYSHLLNIKDNQQ